MASAQIIDRLRGIMAQNATTVGGAAKADWSAVGEADAIADLGIDSLAMLDFMYDIQQEFGVEFDPQDLVGVTTVGQLAAFIEGRASA